MNTAWCSRGVKEVIVYKSNLSNVWANLAFEDWVFQNVNLSFRRILFLWRNSPCVVIGRHQNPWLEANIPLLRERGVGLARRRSGGGAVYHDLGNLNCTMFAHRHDYNRSRNLWLACAALNERWNTNLSVNEHNDIVCKHRWKVSGTSSKLAKDSTYHHYTILLDVDTTNLNQLLRPHPHLQFGRSSATPSRRSEVINLCQVVPELTYDTVSSAIAEKFYDMHQITENRKIVEIDPMSEHHFPGISEMRKELENWQWNYGKTPRFSIEAKKRFDFGHLEFSAEIERGIISRCNIGIPTTSPDDSQLHSSLIQLSHSLIGLRFCYSDVATFLRPHVRTRQGLEWILGFV